MVDSFSPSSGAPHLLDVIHVFGEAIKRYFGHDLPWEVLALALDVVFWLVLISTAWSFIPRVCSFVALSAHWIRAGHSAISDAVRTLRRRIGIWLLRRT